MQWLALRALALGTLCLVGGAIAADWLARRLSRPLRQLTATADRITSRHLDARIELVNGSQEVVRLGEVFNQMLTGLETAFEKQTRFIADASHELRTPVTVVLSQVEHALYRERTTDEYQQALEVCLRSSKRMKTLVDDLLFLARADAGRFILRPVPMDLADVVSRTVELLQPLAAQNTVRLKTDLAATPLTGDPDRLAQVLTNLVTNAIKYNHPGGQVFVESQTEAQHVVLRVRDTGIGIPSEDLPRLFDRFYRVDTARTQQDDTGTGLGLSLVQEIVTAHHGTIDVQSRPGTGTTITVRLPANSNPASPLEAKRMNP